MDPYLAKLSPEQFEFRETPSKTKQLVRLNDFIGSAPLNHQKVALHMLNMVKAFDRIWHEGFILKLICLDISRDLILLIYFFVKNQKFFVNIGTDKSTQKRLKEQPKVPFLAQYYIYFDVADFPCVFSDSNGFAGCYTNDFALAVKSVLKMKSTSFKLSHHRLNIGALPGEF
ncbi:hypothetical protein X975_08938, partial [Stegodyphus mimosarum]